jgi:hypothetical protein
MRTILLLAVLFLVSSASAQTKSPVSDRLGCAQLAHQYLAERNATLGPVSKQYYGRSLFVLEHIHFDFKTEACYVQITQSFDTYPAEATISGWIFQTFVVDVLENIEIAAITYGRTYNQTTREWTYTQPSASACHVGKDKCTSVAEFNSSLWRLIPAFTEAAQ